MNHSSPWAWLLPAAGVLVAAALTAACDDEPEPAAPARGAASAAPSTSASTAASAKPPAPWYAGTWSGTFETQHYLIERTKREGAVAAWDKDEGEKAAGQGRLSLDVDADRRVTGTASGPLGALVASGEMDGDTLRVQLSPKDPRAPETAESFAGTLIAKRKGQLLEGRIQASSGDSRVVRDAAVKLEKAGGGGKP